MAINSDKEILEVAINRMHSALSAFYIWKWFGNAINIHNGKEFAEKNVKTMSTYRYFFQPTRLSLYKCFVADLAIFFDSNKHEETFSLEKLVGILNNKLSSAELSSLKNEIQKIKKKHGVKIDFIQKLRNADVAHQEINSRTRKVIYSEIEELFLAVQDIINLVENRYDKSTHMWSHIEKDISWQMECMFANLERGEKARLKAIDKKYRQSLVRIQAKRK